MRAVTADRKQVVAAEVELVGREQLVRPLVGDLVPLELEEHERRLDRSAQLVGALHQSSALRVGGVEREPQNGIGAGAADEVLDRGELVHGVGETDGTQLGHSVAVPLRERLGAVARLGQHLHDPIGATPAHERLEIPGGGFEGGVHER